jgi:hypothetical protein
MHSKQGALCLVVLTKYNSGDQMKKTEMGRACSTYGERRGIYRGNLRVGDHLKDPGVDGRILLKCIYEKWDERGMDFINLAEGRQRWRAL